MPDVDPWFVFLESLTAPDPRLLKALKKKLTHLESDLLRLWLAEERRVATDREWDRVKDRIPEGN